MTTTRTVEHRHIGWQDFIPRLRDHANVRTLNDFINNITIEDQRVIFCRDTQEIVDLEHGFSGAPIIQECNEQHWRFVSTLISRDDELLD